MKARMNQPTAVLRPSSGHVQVIVILRISWRCTEKETISEHHVSSHRRHHRLCHIQHYHQHRHFGPTVVFTTLAAFTMEQEADSSQVTAVSAPANADDTASPDGNPASQPPPPSDIEAAASAPNHLDPDRCDLCGGPFWDDQKPLRPHESYRPSNF